MSFPSPSDELLDQRLRDVPPPPGLLARLREQAARWAGEADDADASLDAKLRAVALPAGLVDRTRARVEQIFATRGAAAPEAAGAALPDIEIDARLRAVDVPRRLLSRLRRAPRLARDPRGRGALAVAAALLLLCAAYWVGLGLKLGRVFHEPATRVVVPLAFAPPVEADAVWSARLVPAASAPRPIAFPEGTVQLMRLEDATSASREEPASVGPAGELFRELAAGLELSDNFFMLRWGALGDPRRGEDDLPQLELGPAWRPRGVTAPLAREFDRAFLLRSGTHPWVRVGSNPELRSSSPPLRQGAESYEAAWRLLAERRLARPADVHVEDFVAAMEYDLPRPAEGAAARLTVLGGPSDFGRRGVCRLMLGVRAGEWLAGDLAPAQRPPTHLIVAVDVSGSMRFQQRLEQARRALRRLVEALGPRDHVTLLAVGEQTRVVAARAGAEHAVDLLAAIDSLRAEGGSDLASGLQRAVAIALGDELDPAERRRLALVTDGRGEFRGAVEGKLHELLAEARELRLETLFIELGADRSLASAAWNTAAPWESGAPVESNFFGEPGLADDGGDFAGRAALEDHAAPGGASAWGRLAEAAGGAAAQADTDEAARVLLWRHLTGAPSVAATDAHWKVEFNPRAVAAYRLIGHEAPGGGLLADAAPGELHAGRQAVALYDLTLLPNSEQPAAWVEFTWRDPRTGELRHLREEAPRECFVAAFERADPCWQWAAAAAETAEVLRQSPFAHNQRRELDLVSLKLRQLSAARPEEADFARFLKFVALWQETSARPK